MALFENVTEFVFEEAAGPWVLGIGAVLAAPMALPVLRPAAKTMVKGGFFVYGKAREAFSEVSEQWSDLVAEARSEMDSSAESAPETSEHHQEG